MSTSSRVAFVTLSVSLLSACSQLARPAATSQPSPVVTVPTPTTPASRASQNAVSRTCHVRDLAVDFRGGGLATGNDIASLVIRDISLTPCQLVGKVVVAPFDSVGRPIHTYAPIEGLTAPKGLVLSPRSPAVPTGQTATDGRVRAALALAGGERDDPRPPHGSCPAAAEITPASWRVHLAHGSLTVTNHDPGGPSGRSDVPSLYACRGMFFEMSLNVM